jgi:hypothetical protein
VPPSLLRALCLDKEQLLGKNIPDVGGALFDPMMTPYLWLANRPLKSLSLSLSGGGAPCYFDALWKMLDAPAQQAATMPILFVSARKPHLAE